MPLLKKHNIYLFKNKNGFIEVDSNNNRDLAIFIELLAKYKPELEDFLNALNNALENKFNLIEEWQWHQELGFQIYTGIIKQDMTFDVFMEDYYDLLETYPLIDIKEIVEAVLDLMKK